MSSVGDRHERHDVGGADSRVRALMPAQVDPLARAGDPGEERVYELVLVPDEREDRAVVVGVRVDVEELGVLAEGVAQRLDRRRSRPSEKFGTDSSGSLTRVLWSREGVLRRSRAGSTTTGVRDGLFAERDRPGWHEERGRM